MRLIGILGFFRPFRHSRLCSLHSVMNKVTLAVFFTLVASSFAHFEVTSPTSRGFTEVFATKHLFRIRTQILNHLVEDMIPLETTNLSLL